MVVDDEEPLLRYVDRLLTREGCEVDAVDNAGDALERLKTQYYDVVLLDIRLPGMGGIDVKRQDLCTTKEQNRQGL